MNLLLAFPLLLAGCTAAVAPDPVRSARSGSIASWTGGGPSGDAAGAPSILAG